MTACVVNGTMNGVILGDSNENHVFDSEANGVCEDRKIKEDCKDRYGVFKIVPHMKACVKDSLKGDRNALKRPFKKNRNPFKNP